MLPPTDTKADCIDFVTQEFDSLKIPCQRSHIFLIKHLTPVVAELFWLPNRNVTPFRCQWRPLLSLNIPTPECRQQFSPLRQPNTLVCLKRGHVLARPHAVFSLVRMENRKWHHVCRT